MSVTVAGLLLLLFAGAGLLAGRLTRNGVLTLLAGAVVGTAVLFVPVRCATGDLATPFSEGNLEKPTGCESVTGVGLPELGWLSGDTVGYGLAISAVGLALATAALVLGRRAAATSDDGADRHRDHR